MTALEFDPALVEKAARAIYPNVSTPRADEMDHASAVLSAVAPTLRAEGARRVFAAVEAAPVKDGWLAAREAVAHIEGGAA